MSASSVKMECHSSSSSAFGAVGAPSYQKLHQLGANDRHAERVSKLTGAGVAMVRADPALLLAGLPIVGAGHPSHRDGSRLPFPVENDRSMRLTLPWRSLTETTSVPRGRPVIGFSSVSSQMSCSFGLNFAARSCPAGTPATAKSATTRKVFRSRPLE